MGNPFDKAYDLAVRYLARRARSCFEMQHYLSQKKGVDTPVAKQVIERLIDLGYIDDRNFARQFIRDRIRFKPKSRYALGYELKAKGIDETLAAELLDPLDDADLAMEAALQRIDQWKRLAPEDQKKKLMNYLRYRGFDYTTFMVVWEKLFP